MTSKMTSFLLVAVVFLTPLVALAQTDDEVGDVASFGKEAKFFGFAHSGGVIISPDCTTLGFPLGPDDRCFTLSPNLATSFDVRDIGRIKFPKKTFENVIFLSARHTVVYQLVNPSSTSNRTARLVYAPYFTLISPALNDPSLINPQTGLPFNGQLDLTQAGTRNFFKTMFPSYRENDILSYGAPSVSGITKKYLRDNYGIPPPVLDDLFYQEIVIQLNIRGATSNVEQGSMNWSVRFLGN